MGANLSIIPLDRQTCVEAPVAEVEATIEVVHKVMTDAPHSFIQLAVPMLADAKAAQNWDEAH